jgi:hypothetical protein
MEIILPFVLIVVIASGIIFYLYRKMHIQSQIIQDMRADGERWRISPTQDLMQQAHIKADQIVTSAEISSIKTETEKTMEMELFQKDFQEKFAQSMQQVLSTMQQNTASSTQMIEESLKLATQKHDEFIVQLEKQNLSWQNNVETEMRGKINELLGSFENKLTDFFTTAQQQSLEAINLEVKSARQLIESYKSQQLAIVDENIVAVLERTLSLVLKQKLTLKEQLDLVYEALEKAKLEKFLV